MRLEMGGTIQRMRKEQGFTQEQMAEALGVSVAAVSKWENDVSCPDITVLPALARYLRTDLNTLLSFHEKLSAQEAGRIVAEMSDIFFRDGLEKACEFIQEKIKEYPSSDILMLNGALALEGAAMMGESKEDAEPYEAFIERLYEKASRSDDAAVQNQALYMLASKYMRRGEYDRTEEILSRLPENHSFDKTQMQVNLYLSQNRLAEAARLEESKLVTESNSLVMRLVTLMEIAVKEGRMEDARRMAEAASSIAKALDMWEYTVQLPWFELYAYLEDRDNCLKAFDSMLASVTKPWDTAASPLYCHFSKKEQDNRMGEKIKDMLLVSIEEEEQFVFLRQDKRFEEMKKRLGL